MADPTHLSHVENKMVIYARNKSSDPPSSRKGRDEVGVEVTIYITLRGPHQNFLDDEASCHVAYACSVGGENTLHMSDNLQTRTYIHPHLIQTSAKRSENTWLKLDTLTFTDLSPYSLSNSYMYT